MRLCVFCKRKIALFDVKSKQAILLFILCMKLNNKFSIKGTLLAPKVSQAFRIFLRGHNAIFFKLIPEFLFNSIKLKLFVPK